MVLMCHSVFVTETSSKFWVEFLKVAAITRSGLDLFFVLSGFLIGGILLDARSSPNYFKTFYIRRAYRILPLYGIITARFFVSRLHFAQSGPLLPLTIPWFAYVTLTQNLWIAWLGSWGPAAMTVTWSLAVEEQFYLTAPVLIRKLKERTLVVALITVILVAPFKGIAQRLCRARRIQLLFSDAMPRRYSLHGSAGGLCCPQCPFPQAALFSEALALFSDVFSFSRGCLPGLQTILTLRVADEYAWAFLARAVLYRHSIDRAPAGFRLGTEFAFQKMVNVPGHDCLWELPHSHALDLWLSRHLVVLQVLPNRYLICGGTARSRSNSGAGDHLLEVLRAAATPSGSNLHLLRSLEANQQKSLNHRGHGDTQRNATEMQWLLKLCGFSL